MPQDSPREKETKNNSHIIELHHSKHYHHLKEEDDLSKSSDTDSSTPIIIEPTPHISSRGLTRAPAISLHGKVAFHDNRETSSRDEWTKFVKAHQRQRALEKREFQRNLPKKMLKVVLQLVWTPETFVSMIFLLFLIACYVAHDFKSVKVAGDELYLWAFFSCAIVWGFFITKFLVKRIITLSKRFRFFESYVYYFIYSSHRSLSLLIVASILFPFWQQILQDVNNDKIIHYINTSFVVVILLCSTNLVRAVGTKLLTGMANKSHFHQQIVNALFNERMLVNLMMPLKKSKNLPKKKKKFSMKELFGDVELRRFHSMSRLVQKRSLAALDNELASWDEINSTEKARDLAKRVYKNIDRANKGYITKQDISNFVKPKYINKVFSVFDVDKDGKVVREEVEDLVIKIYRERHSLSDGLKDRENMGHVLTNIITFIFWIVMIFITLYIYGVPIIDYITPLAAFFVGLGFVFGESLKDILSSIILIFVIHPYDVGDRITIDKTNTILIVDSIHLLTTHFHTLEGKYVIIKNSVMGGLQIQNYKRSRIASHRFDLHIGFGTPMEKIYNLRLAILQYLSDHPKVWKPDLSFWITDLHNVNKIIVQMWCTTRHTWQEGPTNWVSRTDLLLFIQTRMLEMGITYFEPPQVNYFRTSPDERQFLSQFMPAP